MDIVRCTFADTARWDDFVARSDGGSFYQLFAWKAINEQCFGHETFYLAGVDGDALRGVFPPCRAAGQPDLGAAEWVKTSQEVPGR